MPPAPKYIKYLILFVSVRLTSGHKHNELQNAVVALVVHENYENILDILFDLYGRDHSNTKNPTQEIRAYVR